MILIFLLLINFLLPDARPVECAGVIRLFRRSGCSLIFLWSAPPFRTYSEPRRLSGCLFKYRIFPFIHALRMPDTLPLECAAFPAHFR
jgi:hypothetical protein